MSNVQSTAASQLAILGGSPCYAEPLKGPVWPPVSELTADRLREVYLSRQWSFNSQSEQEFARAFADYHDAKHGIFMMNGTVTLQAALEACGVGSGDEVIVPALTWVATAMAVHYVGAVPVFVDIEPTTLCLDPSKVEDAITNKTRAIIPVHLYGSMADLDAILDIADRHGLDVIEDCAHMQGGKWKGRGVGSWGKVGSFSFQQSKTLSCGEGGICLTNDDNLADRVFRVKHIGYGAGDAQGDSQKGPVVGMTCHNFRATAFQAIILQDQLCQLRDRIERYNANAARLEQRLKDVPGVRVQARGQHAGPQGYYASVLIFDKDVIGDMPMQRVIEALSAEGLASGLEGTYGPVYDHMLFNLSPGQYRIAEGSCPVSEQDGTQCSLCVEHLWLGCDDQIEAVADILMKVATNVDALRKSVK